MNRARRTSIPMFVCVALLLCSSAHAGTGKLRKSKHAVANEYIVILKKDIAPGEVHGLAMRLAADHGRVPQKVWMHAIKGFFVHMTEKEAVNLSEHPAVAFVEENAAMFLAATMPTNVDPAVCNLPGQTDCARTTDNRLWHLDRIDQDSAAGIQPPAGAQSPPAGVNEFAYCATGQNVRIYIVDSGVQGEHSEFKDANGNSRVTAGFNASGDRWAANKPCGGWVPAAVGPLVRAETTHERKQLNRSHGTGVASLAAGRKVGIAKDATIVPVKVARCDMWAARYRQPGQDYEEGALVFDAKIAVAHNAEPNKYWIAVQGGTADATPAVNWSAPPNGGVLKDGSVWWREYKERPVETAPNEDPEVTVQMMLDGLNWIVKTAASTATERSVVSISMFKPVDKYLDVPPGGASSVQQAIHSILDKGIPVIASANNQGGDACAGGPAAFSRENPYGHDDRVITVGGTMLLNDPESVTYEDSQPTRDGRWTDSNGGPCVTLFAPAHRIEVASHYGPTSYRGRTVSVPGQPSEPNSGTSWSAPLVAGVVATYLESGALSVDDVYKRLLADSRGADLDADSLHPTGVNGLTPNRLLRAGSVRIDTHPQSIAAAATGSTVLSVATTPNSGVTYQWFEVNREFDLTGKRGAAKSIPVADATSSTFTVPARGISTGYWVRVTGCGAADSDIAVVVPRPDPPSNLVATADGNGTSVSLSWSAGSGAEKYQVERKVSGQQWTVAGTLDANTNPVAFTDTPTAPGGMVIYRVRSAKGVSYLDANNLALSDPSNNDVANLNSAGYEALNVAPAYTTFKAQMITELRQATNALAVAAGISTMPFTSSEVLASSLQGQTIQNEYLTDLMAKINTVRTNMLVGVPPVAWINTPENDELIHRSFVEELRNALR